MKAILNTDGGARGNPGPAGIGVVLRTTEGEVLAEIGRGIGFATNNVAEYEALIAGLELAHEQGVTEIEILVDSDLVVQQMSGRWKIKNERLRSLAGTARSLMNRFEGASIQHVRRAHNTRADRLANAGMDEVEATSGEIHPDQQSLLE
jgi:ribonuclease H / adenosylcobalamin/alpha-ribazole phosphatase